MVFVRHLAEVTITIGITTGREKMELDEEKSSRARRANVTLSLPVVVGLGLLLLALVGLVIWLIIKALPDKVPPPPSDSPEAAVKRVLDAWRENNRDKIKVNLTGDLRELPRSLAVDALLQIVIGCPPRDPIDIQVSRTDDDHALVRVGAIASCSLRAIVPIIDVSVEFELGRPLQLEFRTLLKDDRWYIEKLPYIP